MNQYAPLEQYEKEFILDVHLDYSIPEIARKLERSCGTIIAAIRKMGVQRSMLGDKPPKHDWPSIWYAYCQLGSYSDAAKATGVSRQLVAYCVQKMIISGCSHRFKTWNRYARSIGREEYSPDQINVGINLPVEKCTWDNGQPSKSWIDKLPGLNKERSRKNNNTLSELAIKAGISPRTVQHRVKNGWSLKDALSIPPLSSSEAIGVGRYVRLESSGKEFLAQKAAEHDLHPNTVYSRLSRGWSLEKALTTKARKKK